MFPSFAKLWWKWVISVHFWDIIDGCNKKVDGGINHFLWKAEFELCEIYVVLDCFILTEWELLFFIKDCNEMGTILHYASQEVVFCENSLKNWPHLQFTKM